MGRTIVGQIEDFYTGETKRITVLCKLDGVAQNITADTVTLIIKGSASDPDSSAVLDVDADVATYGASGIAYWALTPTQMEIAVGSYVIDITWYDGGADEYIVYSGSIKSLERVSDV